MYPSIYNDGYLWWWWLLLGTQGDETLEEFEKLFQELLMDDVNQLKTPSSSFPYTPFSGTVYGDDLSNDDIPNKVNLDSYCCISSGEVFWSAMFSKMYEYKIHLGDNVLS